MITLRLPPRRVGWSASPTLILCALAGLGLMLRLALVPLGIHSDFDAFYRWSEALAVTPLDRFYSLDTINSDYLPGYLYLLLGMAKVKVLVSGVVGPPWEYALWTKALAIFGDLALGCLVYGVCRRYVASRRALLGAALVLLNPALAFNSALWGQGDSVALIPALLALTSVLARQSILAGGWAALALVMKPQYCLFLVAAGISYLGLELKQGPGTPEGTRTPFWLGRRVFFPVLVMVGLAQLLLAPFSVSLLPGTGSGWMLSERILMAADRHAFLSANAFNLWGVLPASSELSDASLVLGGISYQMLGMLLLGGVAAAASACAWKGAGAEGRVLWACFVIALASFVFLTRMHERYLLGGVVLLALAVPLRRGLLTYSILLSLLYLLNLVYAFSTDRPEFLGGLLLNVPMLPQVASLWAVASMGVALVILGQWRDTGCVGNTGDVRSSADSLIE